TPNCGAVVSEGVDGFVVPAADAPALAAALRRYATDRDLAARQRGAALAKARQFSLDRLGAELQSLERALAN
ncbi:MAG TPA: glycosyltransferase family 1 protein, partial [Verrucomicrobiae bacterium]|nr:glycosyltransferase family 1 protein [Verrucomicrobiae bacterium]